MNIFDIIGPVMIGPSSSHTAGAVRIGKIARKLLDEEAAEVVIKLHGSFAETYRGHGTDKALIGGLMGFSTEDERIRNSMELAEKAGMRYRIESISLQDVHPNTAVIEAVGKTGKRVVVMGASIGGGNIVIKKINDLDVEFNGQYCSLIISHIDKPGVIAFVTGRMGNSQINIAGMRDYRSSRGGEAIMILETDQEVDEKTVHDIKNNANIMNVIYMDKI